jgi:hypothetical protein
VRVGKIYNSGIVEKKYWLIQVVTADCGKRFFWISVFCFCTTTARAGTKTEPEIQKKILKEIQKRTRLRQSAVLGKEKF